METKHGTEFEKKSVAKARSLHLEGIAREIARLVAENHKTYPDLELDHSKAKKILKRVGVLLVRHFAANQPRRRADMRPGCFLYAESRSIDSGSGASVFMLSPSPLKDEQLGGPTSMLSPSADGGS